MRFLYIALALATLGTPPVVHAQADDSCAGAMVGTQCPDDQDPCTVDQCDGEGRCQHVAVADRVTCDPVDDAYRRTLGLRDLVDELTSELSGVVLPPNPRSVLDHALAGALADLGRASDALAGRIDVPPPGPGETLALARARAAFGILRVTPPRVRGVSRVLSVPAVRAAIGPSVADLARRVRFLYRSTNQLKQELRRLQRVSGTFTP